MTPPCSVCLVQPTGYIHAMAFQEVAEFIHFSLLDRGHDSVLRINQFDRDRVNIVLGAQLLPPEWQAKLPANTVIVNTEQLGSVQHPWTETLLTLARRYSIWDYNRRNVDYLRAAGIDRLQSLQLGYHPKLHRLSPVAEPDVDVLFYGSLGERRKTLIRQIEARGLRVKTLFGVYGAERDRWIERSKLVLNCHHYETHIFEVVRVFYLLTNGWPVVAEVGVDTEIESPYPDAVCGVPYEQIPEVCERLIHLPAERSALAAQGTARLRAVTPRLPTLLGDST